MFFLNSSNLHHAYLLVGRPEDVLPTLRVSLGERLGVADLSASPDYVEEEYSLFGIKDSHSLRQRQNLSAFGKKGRFFVLTISSATVEAQNALLKTFEEPATDTHFFVILRSEDILLPTLKSRFVIVRPNEKDQNQELEKTAAMDFSTMSPSARLEYVKKNFIKNKNEGKGEVFRFLDDLEKVVYNLYRSGGRVGEPKALMAILQAKKHLANPRASLRLILEHLALAI